MFALLALPLGWWFKVFVNCCLGILAGVLTLVFGCFGVSCSLLKVV